ncbi:hypothetical protein BN14_05858 [Rhizoctonia solani AG-1 IB]|uniref:Uncharacterized protein n=1 Tax=Thanatephorus cucumeris (strain AG1-IB / isolate 7/3/14) TaxID=1108050 RepID=M5BVV2_THACB|nr:hypothetical protein BN14_05858 [Rhizoctonia solani AG-1 IB]
MREIAAQEGRPGWGAWDAVWDTFDFAGHYQSELWKYRHYLGLIQKENRHESTPSSSRSHRLGARPNRINKGKGRATTADEQEHAYSWVPDPYSADEEDDGGFSLDEAEWTDRAKRPRVESDQDDGPSGMRWARSRITASGPPSVESIAGCSHTQLESKYGWNTDAEDCQEFACSHTKLIREKSVNRLEVHKSKGNKFRAVSPDVILISSDDDNIPTLAAEVARSSIAPKEEVIDIADSQSEGHDEPMHATNSWEEPDDIPPQHHNSDELSYSRQRTSVLRETAIDETPPPRARSTPGRHEAPPTEEIADSQDEAEDFNSSDSESKYTQRPPRPPSPNRERVHRLVELNRQINEFAPVSFV